MKALWALRCIVLGETGICKYSIILIKVYERCDLFPSANSTLLSESPARSLATRREPLMGAGFKFRASPLRFWNTQTIFIDLIYS
jgi:hypothetical protein